MKGKALLILAICMLFTALGSAYAADIDNVSTNGLNLEQDSSVNTISLENLEVSSNDSISETNSHEDNLNNYPNVDVSNKASDYEDNGDSYMEVASVENTTIVTNNLTLYKGNGSCLVSTLFDGNNTPIAGQNISFIINGVTYYRVTDENGTATMNINLNPGVYNIKTIFKGTSQYSASSADSTIEVLPTLFGEDIIKYFRNDTQFYATLLNGTGGLYEGATITFNINGVFYEKRTDGNGSAKLNINLAPGKYIITSIAPNGEMIANNVTVLGVIEGNDVIKYFKNGTQFYATLLNGTGAPYVNATITFNINGVFYERKTDGNGSAKLNINLAPGKYIITSIAPNGAMTANNITVLSTIITNDLTKDYLDSKTFNIILLNGTGEPMVNATAQCNINGQITTVNTGDEGVARLPVTLSPGTYIISTSYNGEIVSNIITINSTIPTIIGSNLQGSTNMNISYTVGLTYPTGEPIVNQTIIFNVANQSFTEKTDEFGNATVNVGKLPIGEYLITYKFPGFGGLMSCEGSSIIKIVNSTTIINAEDLHLTYGQSGKFTVILTDLNLTPLVNKTVTFIVNGVSYDKITNSEGAASLNINLPPGNYTIQYSYSKEGELDYAIGYNGIYISKQPAYLIGTDLEVNYGETVHFTVEALNNDSKPITNSNVIIKVNGKEYVCPLYPNGKAILDLSLPVGVYNISYTFPDDSYYECQLLSNTITVKGYKLTGNNITISKGAESSFEILLTDEKGNPVFNKSVEFNILGNIYTSITSEKGIAIVKLPILESDTIIYYNYTENKIFGGQNTVFVHNSISLASIIQAAVNLKNYIENNLVVPETVDIDGVTYTAAQFLYLLSKATESMADNKFDGEFIVIDVVDPSNPSSNTVSGNLYDYKTLAQDIIAYIETNNIAPNSMQTAIGESGYYPLIYALARTVAFYKTNGVMPAYVSLKTVSNVIPYSPLDSPNTITDLSGYLAATKNCQVDDPQIQALAASLTEGLTSEWSKAVAIYNYVRDKVSYSFYYNTKYGAHDTLFKYGTGNCCDEAQALVALFRAAGLPARFVHGTCTFSSGSVYGHVWTQVLIGDTWVVADPTSTRNSLGIVNNWNNYQYTLHGYYRELSF